MEDKIICGNCELEYPSEACDEIGCSGIVDDKELRDKCCIELMPMNE
jgi:hypothetical protein